MLVLWLHIAHPLTYQWMKQSLKIYKIKVINGIDRKWGITSMFTVFRLAYMYCGTSACILKAVLCVQLYGLNSNTCKKSAYIPKIKIKCYKTGVCRLPSYMAHVYKIQHAHTWIQYSQYLNTISPYLFINYT